MQRQIMADMPIFMPVTVHCVKIAHIHTVYEEHKILLIYRCADVGGVHVR